MGELKNTDPAFFGQWSIGQLQVECARLNQVMTDILNDLDKINFQLGATLMSTDMEWKQIKQEEA